MHETPSRLPASRSEFLEFIEASPYAEILRDEPRLRTIVIGAMRQSDDPTTQEIAVGLANGTMTWSTIAATSGYSDFLAKGLTALQQFDFTEWNEHLKAQTDTTPGAPIHGDDEEDLWQGLYRHQR